MAENNLENFIISENKNNIKNTINNYFLSAKASSVSSEQFTPMGGNQAEAVIPTSSARKRSRSDLGSSGLTPEAKREKKILEVVDLTRISNLIKVAKEMWINEEKGEIPEKVRPVFNSIFEKLDCGQHKY